MPGRACGVLGLWLLVTVLVLAGAGSSYARGERTDRVASAWLQVGLGEIAAHRTNPPRAARGLALLSVAMRDASDVRLGLRNAAVAGAAATVLTYLYPDRGTAFAALAARERPGTGRALGQRIGSRAVAQARTDGSDQSWTGTVPVGPGLWVPTLPAFATALEPLAGRWQPWNMWTSSQYRPGPPTPYGTAAYAAEIQEVYDVSRTLTDAQRAIAAFWADGAGTVTPPGHWSQIALTLIRQRRLGTRDATRVLAAVNTAQADAFIACWDAKFAYWSERPVTAIRRELDPTWVPFIATPPFPSYLSGHATTSGAASTVLASFFPSSASLLRSWAAEAAVSRLYGGIHFRSDNEAGLALGRRIGRLAIARHRVHALDR